MKQSVIDQIEIKDYIITKDKAILICTNIIKDQRPPEYFIDYIWCYEVFGEKDDYGAPFVFILDKKEMMYLKGSLIKKNSKEAKNLELLYAKV